VAGSLATFTIAAEQFLLVPLYHRRRSRHWISRHIPTQQLRDL